MRSSQTISHAYNEKFLNGSDYKYCISNDLWSGTWMYNRPNAKTPQNTSEIFPRYVVQYSSNILNLNLDGNLVWIMNGRASPRVWIRSTAMITYTSVWDESSLLIWGLFCPMFEFRSCQIACAVVKIKWTNNFCFAVPRYSEIESRQVNPQYIVRKRTVTRSWMKVLIEAILRIGITTVMRLDSTQPRRHTSPYKQHCMNMTGVVTLASTK